MKALIFTLALSSLVLWPGNTTSQITIDRNRQQPATLTALTNKSSTPLVFTENRGQFGEKTLFKAEAGGAAFYFCRDEVVYLFARETDEPVDENFGPYPGVIEMLDIPTERRFKNEVVMVRASFIGARLNPEIVGVERLPHHSNYYFGSDPSGWRSNVPNYSAVLYKDIYNGIDLKYYGDLRSMKYDFIVKPGADISQIKIRYGGVDNLNVSPTGDLEGQTAYGAISEKAPLIYQEDAGGRKTLAGRYRLIEPGVFGFTVVDEYDSSKSLIIDPLIQFSTYLGGVTKDWSFGVAVDNVGYAYVTGYTLSDDFDTLGIYSPYQGSNAGGKDIFVTKISTTGESLVYSTYLGGENDDWAFGIDADPFYNAYITGYTMSGTDFPIQGGYDTQFDGETDGFIVKLNWAGELNYSTYHGGSSYDACHAIAYQSNYVYVTGFTYSDDFPIAGTSPYQDYQNGLWDAFVSKMVPASGNNLEFSTYLGGRYIEAGTGIDVDLSSNVYVTGWTWSDDFDTDGINFPYQGVHGGGKDAFIVKLNSTGETLLYGSYLGGSYDDYGKDIKVDNSTNAYLTGRTLSSSDFPLKNAHDSSYGDTTDAFVAKINTLNNGPESLIYSTYLGGSGIEYGNAIALEGDYAWVTGWTDSPDFETVGSPVQDVLDGARDVFISKFSITGSPYPDPLEYSTYLGGSENDYGYGIAAITTLNTIYVTGKTESPDFDISGLAFQRDYEGNYDAFVAKFLTEGDTPIAEIDSIGPNPQVWGNPVYFAGIGYPIGDILEYRWISDIDGLLSTESAFPTTSLSVGTHNISFSVKIAGEIWSLEATGSVTILPSGNDPPTATILDISPNPANPGDNVMFAGEGVDDGSVVLYVWESDIDSIFASSADAHTVYVDTLSAGTHRISFRVQDDNGDWSDDDTQTLDIVEEEWEISFYPPSGSDFEAKMHDAYNCTLLVTNVTQVDQVFDYGWHNPIWDQFLWFLLPSPQIYGVEDSRILLNGSSFLSEIVHQDTIAPHETKEYIFSIRHDWDWIPPWGLGRIASIVVSVAFSAATGTSAIPDEIGTIVMWAGFFQHVHQRFMDSNPISEITLSGMGDISDLSHTSTAHVREEKIIFFWESYLLGKFASDFTSAGFKALTAGTPPTSTSIAIACFIVEAILYGVSERLYVASVDPDPDYMTVINTSGNWTGPNLDDMEEGWWKTMAQTSIDMYLASDACCRSYAKYLGALDAGASNWALIQLAATNGFVEEQTALAEKLKTLIDDNFSYFDELTCDIAAIKDSIDGEWASTNGLPYVEKKYFDALTGLGHFTISETALDSLSLCYETASDEFYDYGTDSLLVGFDNLLTTLEFSSLSLLLQTLEESIPAGLIIDPDTILPWDYPAILACKLEFPSIDITDNYRILTANLNGSLAGTIIDQGPLSYTDSDGNGYPEIEVEFAMAGVVTLLDNYKDLLTVSGILENSFSGETFDYSGSTVATVVFKLEINQALIYYIDGGEGAEAENVPFSICRPNSNALPADIYYNITSEGTIGAALDQNGAIAGLSGGVCSDVNGIVDASAANDADTDNLTITASDFRKLYTATCQQGVIVGPNCVVTVDPPTGLDFGIVPWNEYVEREFTITNDGAGTLTGTVSSPCPEYTIQPQSDNPYSLTAGQTATIVVRLTSSSSSTGRINCTIETGNGVCADVACTGYLALEPCSREGNPIFFDRFIDSYPQTVKVVRGEIWCPDISVANDEFDYASQCQALDTFCVLYEDVLGWPITADPWSEECFILGYGVFENLDICIEVPFNAPIGAFNTLTATAAYSDLLGECDIDCDPCFEVPNYPWIMSQVLEVVAAPPTIQILQDSLCLVDYGVDEVYVPFWICNDDPYSDPITYGYEIKSSSCPWGSSTTTSTVYDVLGGDCSCVFGVLNTATASIGDYCSVTIIAWSISAPVVYDTCVQIVRVIEPLPVPNLSRLSLTILVLLVILSASVIMRRRWITRPQ